MENQSTISNIDYDTVKNIIKDQKEIIGNKNFEVKELFISIWPNITSKTGFGRKFKALVKANEFPDIEYVGLGSNRHDNYRFVS